MTTTLLIDADGVAFRVAAAMQSTIHWDDDIITTHVDFKDVRESFKATIEEYREAVDSDAKVILCFSCPTRRYFRHDLYEGYKANRKSASPLGLKPLRAWASENYETRVKDNLEADDVIGILATHPKLIKGEKIVVSQDKDLQQVPGLHLPFGDPNAGVHRIRPEFCERFMWTQVLTGDTSDGYTGLPGCGPVKAASILGTARPDEPYWQLVLGAYRKAGLEESDMVLQFNLARILLHTDYDFTKKEPIICQTFLPLSKPAAPATATSTPTRKSRKASKTSSARPQAGAA